MTELKPSRSLRTLKDMEFYGTDYKVHSEIIEELKAEAIKWVKKYREDCINSLDENAFMEFHNITEDDLKVVKDLK